MELIQQVYALLKFERDGGLETCLRGAECNGALKELREACLEGIAILQDNECQDDSIQEVVAKVSKALGEALYMSAKRGVGKRVFNRYTKGKPPRENFIETQYVRAPVLARVYLVLSMKTICEASKAALEKGALNEGEFLYK